jgi:uncharacterized protein (TIGR03083 family)
VLNELEQVADQLREERRLLNRTLDSLTESQGVAIQVTPDWSIRDIVAHMAGSERGMLRLAQRMARGENPQLPPDYDNDVYNARQVAKRKNLSLVQLREEMEASRAELMAFMEGLTPGQLTLGGEHPIVGQTTVKGLIEVLGNHEASHTLEIINLIHELEK